MRENNVLRNVSTLLKAYPTWKSSYSWARSTRDAKHTTDVSKCIYKKIPIHGYQGTVYNDMRFRSIGWRFSKRTIEVKSC